MTCNEYTKSNVKKAVATAAYQIMDNSHIFGRYYRSHINQSIN